MSLGSLLKNPRQLYERRGEILPWLAGRFHRLGYRCGLVLDRNGRGLQSLRNIHAGKRAFIIGNGPSLKVSDLDLLKDEITFASNKIYLAFEQTGWRPTYYSVFDALVAKNNSDTISRQPLTKIFSEQIRPYLPAERDALWVWESPANMDVLAYCDGTGPAVTARFSQNPLLGLEGGWTVVYSQMQLAYFMGIREVVLVGIDFSFSVPETKVKSNVGGYDVHLKSQGEVNHFHPQYRSAGESWTIPRMDCMLVAYAAARDIFAAAGGRIVNASRVTKLELFERVTLEELLAAGRAGSNGQVGDA